MQQKKYCVPRFRRILNAKYVLDENWVGLLYR